MRFKKLKLRLRRLSSNKYYISNGGFKHTNNKVYINLFVFNRQRTNYISLITKRYLKRFLSNGFANSINKDVQLAKKRKNIQVKLVKKLQQINTKGIQAVKFVNRDKYLLIKALNFINKRTSYNIHTFKGLSSYTENFYKKLIKRSFRRIKLYFYYKQLIYINMSKLNYTYLQSLKKQLENLYNKNVEFNLINLKRFYLNSDILSESITKKLARNRRKLIKYMNSLRNKVKITDKKEILSYSTTFRQNIASASTNKPYNSLVRPHNKLLLQNYILTNLKYSNVTGFRLEAKGRLSKRFTASRSLYKTNGKGGIQDINSSYLGLSSVLLKGNLKSNTQFTKISSKTRIGSFGIKG